MANYVKFMRGTPEAYKRLIHKNEDTLYFISEKDAADGVLYLGSKLISGEGDSINELSISALKDVLIENNLSDQSFLVYDESKKLWVNKNLDDLIFVGSTGLSSGLPGLVPPPPATSSNLFLRSDGTWAEINGSGDIEPSNILTIENLNNTIPHNTLLNDIVNPKNGDIVIIKDLIIDDKWQYTAYVYDQLAWTAMDGNYDSENIFFKDDLIFTENVGTIVIPDSGSTIVPAAGKNLNELLDTIFKQEKNPLITQPNLSIESETAQGYEVGTFVTPKYKLTFTPGLYQFGPNTNISVEQIKINNINVDSMEGSLTEIQVNDDTEFYINAQINYSDGSIPFTNLLNEYQEGQIKANATDIIQSKKIYGYRNYYIGADNTNDIIDSNFIKTKLQSQGETSKKKNFTWSANNYKNIKRYIIAIPINSNYVLDKAIITTSMNADVTSEYILQENAVDVFGANDYMATPYNIWIYEPALISSVEIHSIQLKEKEG